MKFFESLSVSLFHVVESFFLRTTSQLITRAAVLSGYQAISRASEAKFLRRENSKIGSDFFVSVFQETQDVRRDTICKQVIVQLTTGAAWQSPAVFAFRCFTFRTFQRLLEFIAKYAADFPCWHLVTSFSLHSE